MTSRQLLAWMFGFIRPVRSQVFFACLWLALFCGLEVLSVRQGGIAITRIFSLGVLGNKAPPFWTWFWHGEGHPLRLRGLFSQLVHKDFALAAPLRDIILVFVAVMSVLLVIRYLMTVSRTKMSMSMVYYIREAIYDKLQRVGFGFHDAVTSGQLINRALSDLQNVRAFIETAVLITLEIVLIVGGYILLIVTLSPWVALLALVPLPIWTWYVLRFSKRIQPAAKSVMEAEDKNVSIITENIAGVHVVKAFATERREIDKYGANCDTFFDRVRTRIRLFADFQPIIRTIATASYLTLFLAAGILIIRGQLDVGSLLVLGGAMTAILSRLQQVAAINEQYQNAIVSARRLLEVLVAPATVPEAPGAKALPPGPGAVRFEHVTFGYGGVAATGSKKDKSKADGKGDTNGDGKADESGNGVAVDAPAIKPVLHDISFDVPGGSIVAIVGPTGAGKTTLVNLISRFYDPQHGRILIDAIDTRDASLASLRTQVSLVFQETYLFSDTVAGNIAYGRPGISEGEIEAAARLAQAHEFIEDLKDGYQTMLGERGSSLSGGQRQRLAIARAILTNPRILVLDDATASVDPETEEAIRRGMHVVMKGRTTFVIAHRISTVKQADVVIVLEHGRITQMGTHDELMRQAGHYREIAAVQLYGDDTLPPAGEESPSHMDRVQGPLEVAAAVESVDREEAKSEM